MCLSLGSPTLQMDYRFRFKISNTSLVYGPLSRSHSHYWITLMITRVACMSDSYIPFYKALPLSRIVCIAHLYASFVSSLISRGVHSRLLCRPFLFFTLSDSLKCPIRFVNCSIRFSTSLSSHVFKDSPLTSEADLLSRWSKRAYPDKYNLYNDKFNGGKALHDPMSPSIEGAHFSTTSSQYGR